MSQEITLKLDFDQDLLKEIQKLHPDCDDYRIINQTLDARRANRGRKPQYEYLVEIVKKGESFKISKDEFSKKIVKTKPIIVGSGPAGLFCALRLLEYGVTSLIIERGDRANIRMKRIADFWRYGKFHEESNVCFGEGGAGLFSDGKLTTRIKSPYVSYVMKKLVEFGAPEHVAYTKNPHLGSNKIRSLIGNIVGFLEKSGCTVLFNTKVSDLLCEGDKVVGVKLSNGSELKSPHVVLATGHSARDVYEMLRSLGVMMDKKDFAVGVRIEHPRELIDKIQYGDFCRDQKLGSAKYRLSFDNKKSERGTYSFCMCPGGYVLSSGTEADGIVVNGMSNYNRFAPWTNSALVVTVKNQMDLSNDLFSGVKFQREIEHKAYLESKKEATGKELPAVRVTDFLNQRCSNSLPNSSAPSKIFKSDLSKILPKFVLDELRLALLDFDNKMRGFIHQEAILIAPETRTSAPLSIKRDRESFESLSHKGLYPCGEGAGQAGGITSAAVDGINVAESILRLST